MVDKEGTYDSGKVRMYEELISGKEVVDLSPPQALDRAKYFLVEQGYVVVQRTATTLTVAPGRFRGRSQARRRAEGGGYGRASARWWSKDKGERQRP
jgi:hypothetical protein